MNDEQRPKIIFFGNTRYSVIDAGELLERFGLAAVVTIPDRTDPKKKIFQSPVKVFALQEKIPIIEATKLTTDIVERIKTHKPDFLVVADYGLILPKALLSIPTYASLNVHHSLLPKYRGPAPAPAAILQGEEESGVSIISMNERVDAGDILKQVRYSLEPDETTDTLLTKLNQLGSKAVSEVITEILCGRAQKEKQDETKATYTKYMTKNDGLVSLADDGMRNWRKIRAYGTWPGTFFIANRKGKEIRVKIAKASYADGKLIVERVIPENGKEMGYKDFLRGL